MGKLFAVALLSYAIGSIPAAYLIGKYGFHMDIRKQGSGNSGATNALRTMGIVAGVGTLLFDVCKGALCVVLGQKIAAADGACCAAIFVALGHCFSIFLKGKGGKGVATAVGVLFCLSPALVLPLFVVFFIVVATTRLVSLGSILATVTAPIAAYFMGLRGKPYGVVCLLVLLILWKHRTNLHRLLRGEEKPIAVSKKKEDD